MEELKIWQKTYDMIKYGNQCILQFPKSERFALGNEIKQSMYKMLRLISVANRSRNKRPLLTELDVELDVLRAFVRLASDPDTRYLTIKKYEHWSKQLSEIGRMIGGWMKTA